MSSAGVEVPEVPSGGQRKDHTNHKVTKSKRQWKTAALMARDLPDPWAELGFGELEEESVTRHMYNPRNGKWKTDDIVVKVQPEVRSCVQ